MFELCIQNIDDVIIAEKYKKIINRIELNSAIEVGGLTPDLEILKIAKQKTTIPIIAMLRVRSGNFTYTDLEFLAMYESAKNLLKYADGIAFGALNEDDTIDIDKTKIILNLCKEYKKEFVFHRAIDVSKNYLENIKILDNMGVDRILTSGHEQNVELGFDNIKNIRTKCEILLGSGINIKNYSKFMNFNVHGTFSKKVDSKLFGYYLKLDENNLKVLYSEKATY